MSGIAMLLAGVIVGAVAVSLLWAVIIAVGKKSSERRERERGGRMNEIADLLAKADAIQANYRCGVSEKGNFGQEMSAVVGQISGLLRPNIQDFGVFFVKYVEQQVEEYTRLVENPERRKAERRKFVASKTTPPPAPVTEDIVIVEEDDLTAKHADDTPASVPAAEPEVVIEPPAAAVSSADTFAPDEVNAFEPSDVSIDPEVLERFVSGADEKSAEPDAFELPASIGELGADAAAESWSEKSEEEYAADFEQFEGLGVEAAAVSDTLSMRAEEEESAVETDAEEPEAAKEAEVVFDAEEIPLDRTIEIAVEDMPAAAPEPESEPEPVADDAAKEEAEADAVLEDEEDVFDLSATTPLFEPDLELTETISFDRSMMADFAANPIYAHPPVKEEAGKDKDANASITGDDVVNSIDSFFKLK